MKKLTAFIAIVAAAIYLAMLLGCNDSYSASVSGTVTAKQDDNTVKYEGWRMDRLAARGVVQLAPDLYESVRVGDRIYIDKTENKVTITHLSVEVVE